MCALRAALLLEVLRGLTGYTWDDDLCERDIVVWHKDQLEQVAGGRVIVDLGAHCAHQLNDALGHLVPGSGLATHHTHPWHHLRRVHEI